MTQVGSDAHRGDGAAAYLAAATEAVATAAAQRAEIDRAADLVVEATRSGHRVLAFGTGHSHMIAEELYTRAGGPAYVEAVLEPALMLHEGPAKSSALEKLPGYGRVLAEQAGPTQGDVVVVVSNSGRNAVPVEFAEYAKSVGATVVAVTSREHSGAVASRAPSGRRLFEVADLVLDNASPTGDATVDLPGRPERAGAVSTVTGALLVQAVVTEAAYRLAAAGVDPQVLVSYNVDPAAVGDTAGTPHAANAAGSGARR